MTLASRVNPLLWFFAVLAVVAATLMAPWGQPSAYAVTTKTVCLRSEVPTGWVIISENFHSSCTTQPGFVIEVPPADGSITQMCHDNLAGIPAAFVIVSETKTGGGCTGFLAGTWSIRTPNKIGDTTICRVNLGQIPAGYHEIGGSTTGGQCPSLPGYWIIAPN